MQLQKRYDELEKRDTVVIAIAQEDKSVEEFAGFYGAGFAPAPRFEAVVDIDRERTTAYDRTSAYLIDKQGIVREVFPMLIHYRATWDAILGEIDRLP